MVCVICDSVCCTTILVAVAVLVSVVTVVEVSVLVTVIVLVWNSVESCFVTDTTVLVVAGAVELQT